MSITLAMGCAGCVWALGGCFTPAEGSYHDVEGQIYEIGKIAQSDALLPAFLQENPQGGGIYTGYSATPLQNGARRVAFDTTRAVKPLFQISAARDATISLRITGEVTGEARVVAVHEGQVVETLWTGMGQNGAVEFEAPKGVTTIALTLVNASGEFAFSGLPEGAAEYSFAAL